MISPEEIRIGRIDQVQKVQIKTIKLEDDQPRRIAYSAALSAYGVVCLKETFNRSTGKEERTSSFKIIDESTFEGTHHQLVSLAKADITSSTTGL